MNVVQCRNLLMISFLGNGSPMIPFFFFCLDLLALPVLVRSLLECVKSAHASIESTRQSSNSTPARGCRGCRDLRGY